MPKSMKLLTRARGRRRLLAGTARTTNPNGRISNTVFPIKHMVVTGALTTGFEFYGLFDTVAEAGQWVQDNLKIGLSYRIHDVFDVGKRDV